MKEIMDTSLVEGYIFFFEVLDMVGKECQHILLAVIGFLAQCLVGQCADTAVALQCALAYLEQHAQILIVEKADTFRDSRLFPLSLHRQQQFVLTVKPFHQLLHPALEVVSCKQFHDLCPPSFWFAAARAQRMVAFQFLRCCRVLVYGARFKQAVYFRLPVAAFTAKHDITDALLAAHTLEGAGTHVKQVRRLACGEQPVGRIVAFLSPEAARTCAAISAICSVNDRKAELSIVITFIFSPFFWFLRQNSAINKRGFNNSLRDSRKIFTEDGSVTRSNGATGSLSAENGTCSRATALPLRANR